MHVVAIAAPTHTVTCVRHACTWHPKSLHGTWGKNGEGADLVIDAEGDHGCVGVDVAEVA